MKFFCKISDRIKSVINLNYNNYNYKNKSLNLKPELLFKAKTSKYKIYDEINKTFPAGTNLEMNCIYKQLNKIKSRRTLKSQESLFKMKGKNNEQNNKKLWSLIL